MKARIDRLSRRRFLYLAGSTAASGLLAACTSGKPSQPARQTVSRLETAGKAGATLKIAQQTHFVPAYNDWFTKEFAPQWGAQNGVTVSVDLYPSADLYSRAAGEVATQSGHDLFAFTSPPSVFETEALDMQDVVSELERKFGEMVPLVKQTVYNPKTQKWFGVSDHYVPAPPVYRKDAWEAVEPGSAPDKWEDILRVGRKLKARGKPIGIGLSPEFDTNTALRGLLYSYGATEQDENGGLTINSANTIEAIKVMTAIYQETMTPEVFSWSSSSNNQFILSGTGSLVINAISAIRTAEKSNPDLAKNLAIWNTPAGPVRRLIPANIIDTYVLWKFSPSIDLAKKFLIDLISSYNTAFLKSELYNFPSFPGSVPNYTAKFQQDSAANPPGKYALLEKAGEWMTSFGYPGFTNAAISEMIDSFVLMRMFAMAARGEMEPADAARWAEKELKRIFQKWKARGLV